MITEKPCWECWMSVRLGEYHTFAACIIFKGCQSSSTVRANLKAITTEWQVISLRAHKNEAVK